MDTMRRTYEDLEKRARRLIESETTIPSLKWGKEAHAVKIQARKAYAMDCISRDEMVKLIKMVMEVEEDEIQ